jgi:hypothetical protein
VLGDEGDVNIFTSKLPELLDLLDKKSCTSAFLTGTAENSKQE